MAESPRNLTWPAQQALSVAASGKPSSAWHPADRLLTALLTDPACDATHTLLACGHDPAKLRERVRQEAAGHKASGAHTADSLSADDPDSALLRAARAEADRFGALSITTRDLLLAALQQPAPGVLALQREHAVDPSTIRQQPVQVYEALEKPHPVRPRRKRSPFMISPIFLGLVALMVGTGLYLYFGQEPHAIGVFVFVTVGWIVSLALHEFGHALAAYLGGDESVVDKGYLTLNPLLYTHPLLSIVMPVFFLLMGGIGLPGGAVFVNTRALRSRTAYTLVSAAGPMANLTFAFLLAVPFFAIDDLAVWFLHTEFWSAVAFLILLQITAILLNLIPIPGLDGFGIMAPWLPDSALQVFLPLSRYGFFILLILFWYVEPFSDWFWGQVFVMMDQLHVDGLFYINGLELYRFWQ